MVDFPKSLSPKRVLKLLKAEKNPHAAFALLDSVTRHPKYNHSPDVFHHILRRLVDPKLVAHVDRVVELVRTQKCKCPEDVALTVIKAYTKNSMPDKAMAVFQQMEEIFGCAPGTYNVLIKISCKKKHFEKAKGLLNWMWEKGLEPDVFSYGALINGLAKGDSVSANEIWERLVKDSEVYPNVVTYNVVVNGLCKCGKVNESLEIWSGMKTNDRGPDFFSLGAMASAFAHEQ
ncbi:hypothetical protein TB2_032390 [Malus domestica]